MNLINSAFHTNIAFITPDGFKATYENLYSFTERTKIYLLNKPLIFCLCENTPGSLLGYTTFLTNGAVPLMLDAKIDAGLLHNLINIYQPNYIWLPDYLTSLIKSEKIVFSEAGYSLHLFSSAKVALHQDLALLLTTSGSTGSPKLVRLSYTNILANARSIAQYLAINENERPVTSLPMHYSFGLSVINSHLISGATLLLTNHTLLEREFWNFVCEQQATSLSGVPYTFEMLHRLRFLRMNLPALKTMTQAGGKLSAKLIEEYCEQCRKSGKQFIVMYGQTEATARMSYLPFDKAQGKYNSIGFAIPGGKFTLMDEKGYEIDHAEVDGELIYTGDNVSLGYAEVQSDLAKGDENKGTLHTGDIARRDEGGFYYITGRLKRFVKLYGNRINLDAIEQLLRSTDEGEYVCAGIDDHLIIYTTLSGKTERIIHFLSEKTGINSQAFTVKEIVEIPKNSSGKILYTELNQL
jgi:acyl-CoA synthetase (AMP-forming)/AMP-acid ligase II